ncbi:MAG: hypothetical protein E6G66_12130 [Actinobacteria bacterium]|nr:MAG: hypothetical protein E6G66_12130 [Actinomycetota bacterium]
MLVLSGDSPLITSRTLAALVDKHRSSGATVTLLTALMDDPTGYGRIIRSPVGVQGGIRIVEQADASPHEAAVQEVSTGFWCFEREPLFDALAKVTTDNAQGEYYLPDVVPLLAADGARVETLLGDRSEILGVNDRKQLAEAARILRARKLDELMAAGVTIEDPAVTYVDMGVEVGRGGELRRAQVGRGRPGRGGRPVQLAAARDPAQGPGKGRLLRRDEVDHRRRGIQGPAPVLHG